MFRVVFSSFHSDVYMFLRQIYLWLGLYTRNGDPNEKMKVVWEWCLTMTENVILTGYFQKVQTTRYNVTKKTRYNALKKYNSRKVCPVFIRKIVKVIERTQAYIVYWDRNLMVTIWLPFKIRNTRRNIPPPPKKSGKINN